MRNLWQTRPSPALIVACIALFASLGGTGYAAARAGTASASRHTASKPVTAKQVNKLIATYIAHHHGLQGPAGAQGAQGSTGAPGLQGEPGHAGPQGPGAQRIVASQRGTVSLAPIATIGPWTVSMECEPGVARIKFSGPGSYADTVTRGLVGETAETENDGGLIEAGVSTGIGNDEHMDLHGFLIDEPTLEQFSLQVSDFKGLISTCSVIGDAIPVS
ncbi:MAG TPA: hypothetical protein VK790_02820 [Solirubrobacteraceae bacterium]|jgi:hypothetical protein|nr:hypothetical protein [Solirubrobacteraceae bacterium]